MVEAILCQFGGLALKKQSFLFLSLGLLTLEAPKYHVRPPTTLLKKACEKVLNPQPFGLNEATFDPPAETLAVEHHGCHMENCPAKPCLSFDHKILKYNEMGVVLQHSGLR